MITRAFLREKPPDIAVLIDYPGVNIPFAQYLKKNFGCRIIYYIPPNEWLVFTARTSTIVQISDLILCVYPGEADYYRKAGGNVLEVGHPLLDRAELISYKQAREKLGIKGDDIVIALVPASREQELKHVWPLIASAAKLLLQNANKSSSIRFFVPVVLSNRAKYLEKSLEENGLSQHAQIWDGTSDTVLAASDLAITKSGSVNLELALYNVPQVVVYKLSGITAWILRNVFQFSTKHISLVNLILGEQLVPELIQENASAQNIMEAALELLPCNNSERRKKVLEGYQHLRSILGQSGVAARAANIILSFLNPIEI